MNSEDDFLGHLYQRFPIVIDRGKGAKVWDDAGKEYIDCMAGYGVALVGHCNDRVVEAIKDQIEKLMVCHMSTYNTARSTMLKKSRWRGPETTLRKRPISFLRWSIGTQYIKAAIRRMAGRVGRSSTGGWA